MLDGKIIEKEDSGKRDVNGKELTLKPEKEIIQLGRRTKEGIIHDPGQELILSAPKSVSIMHLVAKDKRLEEVHHNAIKAVARYIEKNMLYTRIQKEGKLELVRADNVSCAYFTHLTARLAKGEGKVKVEKAPDPQLHSHLIFCNATKCEDGKWRSIVFDKLYDYQL
ncbi:MobF family relaxase [Rickettsiales endosymbiont of Trichoplax sp. H2]|uniref:MobF family relaxase n=1 Tax=Rickettsiales endosymbiont of Trichoplax sp. H2 TaxID=2021221 RepID=UPI0012B2CA6C|nr:MobF family relaxase [Rickettsiales endosymbiont of Trichoplax sp. H2]MSO13538.1 Multifunctional conjugation protein TraI [Rickettsiales endosymbiont of Trichoplax sp. H2]